MHSFRMQNALSTRKNQNQHSAYYPLCVCVCVFTYVYIYMCMYIYTYFCYYVYIYVYIYNYAYTVQLIHMDIWCHNRPVKVVHTNTPNLYNDKQCYAGFGDLPIEDGNFPYLNVSLPERNSTKKCKYQVIQGA